MMEFILFTVSVVIAAWFPRCFREEIWGPYRKFLMDESLSHYQASILVLNTLAILLLPIHGWVEGVTMVALINLVMLTLYIDLKTKFLFHLISSGIFVLSGMASIQYGINEAWYIGLTGILLLISFKWNPVKGLGGGDIPLIIALLPLIEPLLIPVFIFVSAVFTLVEAVISRKNRTPMGPGIIGGAAVCLFFKNPLLSFIY